MSAAQLRGLGYSRDQIHDAARAGRIHRLRKSVYAVGHTSLSWHGRCLAAVLSSMPAVASHAAAGRVWGLLPYDPGTIDITAAARRRAKPTVRGHYARLTPVDEDERDRIPVTSVPRTLLDLAAVLRPARLEAAVERAEQLRVFDLAGIDELLARASRHRGVANLRRALAAYRDDPAFTRSHLERRFLALVRKAGLPIPSMNFNVAGFELDAYWRPERLAVELDVYATHGGRAAFERDRRRDEQLALAGVQVIRVTGRRIDTEPEGVVERIAALLESRRRDLGVSRSPGGGAR